MNLRIPLVSVLCLLITLGCTAPPTASPAAQPTQASGQKPAWQIEMEQLYDEAKKEGEVIVWGNAGPDAREFEKEAFEKAYPGIRVTHFQAPSTGERDSRFLQEFQAGVAKVDVMVGGGAGANSRVKPAGALQDVRPYLFLPEVTDPKSWEDGGYLWVDEEQMYMIQGTATPSIAMVTHKSIAPSEIQSWWDLLNPKWRGKIVMEDPRGSGGGFSRALFFYYMPELGPDFTRRFWSETGVTFAPDRRQNIEWVASQRYLINLSPENGEVVEADKLGLDINIVPVLRLNDTKRADIFAGSPGIAFVPNLTPLPHPNAAKLYLNWFYSKAGQAALQDIRQTASRRVDLAKDKLPSYLVPQPGVFYFVASQYTAADVVKEMRDDVNRWLPQ